MAAQPPAGFEQLVAELQSLKKKYQALRQENTLLQANVEKSAALLKKKDRQIYHILDLKIMGLTEKSGESALADRLRALKTDLQVANTLSNKIRELEHDVAMKDDDLKTLKSSMKFTLIKELQIEAQAYYNEARRLKKILDKKMGDPTAEQFGDDAEYEALQMEAQELRAENARLLQERRLEEQSRAVLHTLRRKMSSLQSDVHTLGTTRTGEPDPPYWSNRASREQLSAAAGSRSASRAASRPASASLSRSVKGSASSRPASAMSQRSARSSLTPTAAPVFAEYC